RRDRATRPAGSAADPCAVTGNDRVAKMAAPAGGLVLAHPGSRLNARATDGAPDPHQAECAPMRLAAIIDLQLGSGLENLTEAARGHAEMLGKHGGEAAGCEPYGPGNCSGRQGGPMEQRACLEHALQRHVTMGRAPGLALERLGEMKE